MCLSLACLKFTFSEKATKIEKKIFAVNLTVCSNCQIDGKISSIFVAFLENMNFIYFASLKKIEFKSYLASKYLAEKSTFIYYSSL